jgi:hypothetical protein
MTLPVPRPGLIIRYAFLWSTEAAEGAVEGAKDRPCAIVVATRRAPDGEIRTIVAPLTHSAPRDPMTSLAIPPQICRQLGLDHGLHWLRFDELNSFIWPGYDLRPLPGQNSRYDYGMLPSGLFQQLRDSILALQKARAGRIVPRD